MASNAVEAFFFPGGNHEKLMEIQCRSRDHIHADRLGDEGGGGLSMLEPMEKEIPVPEETASA